MATRAVKRINPKYSNHKYDCEWSLAKAGANTILNKAQIPGRVLVRKSDKAN